MKHQIAPSAYQRLGSKLELLQHRTGWVLRDICGPAYFWNPARQTWDIAHAIKEFEPYLLQLEAGLELLATVEPMGS